MSRQKNDGGGRWGGRAKGTPNKPKAPFSVWTADLLSKNRKVIEEGIKSMEPREAAVVLSRLSVALSKPDFAEFIEQMCQVRVSVVETREGCHRLSVERVPENTNANIMYRP